MQPIPRRWRAAFATAVLGSAIAAAAPAANAEVISIDANRNVTTFHNIDFIAVFGWNVGDSTTVEVFRNDQRIGSATGPAVAVDEGLPLQGALEVNHGPEGAAQPGDCWENFTPDIQPGDRVVVTQGAQEDSMIIDPIYVDEGPFLNGDGMVEVRGRAARPGGAAIPIDFLDSGGVLNTSKFRGGPNQLFRTPGTTDGWTMLYDPAIPMSEPVSRDGREPDGISTQERLDLLLSGEHGMGYGHVAPLPRETQLYEGNAEAPGPAPGCSPASESNRVDSLDDSAVNINSGNLVVTGKAMAGTFDDDITEVVPKISDGTTTITGATVDVSGDVRDWTATFTRAQLNTLADGKLTVSADYVTSVGPISGLTKTLAKDVVAPSVTADRAPGDYEGPLSVALSAAPGDTITYRTDGLPNSGTDRAYTGPIALPTGATTIAARVTDAAGNFTDTQFAYNVAAPPVAAAAAPAPVTVVRPVTVTVPQLTLNARSLRGAKRMKLRSARRRGLRISFAVQRGARVAQARLYRMKGSSKVLVESRSLNVFSSRRAAVRFRKINRAGLYLVEIRVGATRRTLGSASSIRTRVIR